MATPLLSALGLTPGPEFLDELRGLVNQGKVDYKKLSLATILEIRLRNSPNRPTDCPCPNAHYFNSHEKLWPVQLTVK